jgi:hypothetical protein
MSHSEALSCLDSMLSFLDSLLTCLLSLSECPYRYVVCPETPLHVYGAVMPWKLVILSCESPTQSIEPLDMHR